MAPRPPQENEPGKPFQPSLGSNTEKTIQKTQHQSERTKRVDRILEDWEAGYQRRLNLDFKDRLKEDGQKLRGKIESDSGMTAFLEVSRSRRARCRAEDDCLHVRKNFASLAAIVTDFRIRLEGVKDLSFWRPVTHYYHVECFDWMVGLENLIPENLKLEDESWGLMVRKWFEHKGRIDLAKIGAYVKEYKAFEEDKRDNPHRMPLYIEWRLSGHADCVPGAAGCSHPLPPKPAGTPILRDYILEDGRLGCPLSSVLYHELMNELPDSFLSAGWCVARFAPEVEVEDYSLEKGPDDVGPTRKNEDVVEKETGQEEGVSGG